MDKLFINGKEMVMPEGTELITKESEIERVTSMSDLDCAAKLIAKLFILCTPDQKDRDKLFRRLHPGIGDYMGTGYAFLDAFDKISNEFSETASDLLYHKVREELDNERNKNQ